MNTTSKHPALAYAAGLTLVAASFGMLGAGAYAAVAGTGGSFVELGAHGGYQSDRYALATDTTDWRAQFLGWGDAVRLKVASRNPKPIFVGVAPADAIHRYLAGTGYSTVAEHNGRDVVRFDHDGAAPALPPARAVHWTANAEGVGTQTLRWKATDGPQVVFAMNADGSRPVRVRVVSSAITLGRMPWWVPAGLLLLGVVLLRIGLGVLRRAARARRAA